MTIALSPLLPTSTPLDDEDRERATIRQARVVIQRDVVRFRKHEIRMRERERLHEGEVVEVRFDAPIHVAVQQPSPPFVGLHAHVQCWTRRQCVEVGSRGVRHLYDGSVDVGRRGAPKQQ